MVRRKKTPQGEVLIPLRRLLNIYLASRGIYSAAKRLRLAVFTVCYKDPANVLSGNRFVQIIGHCNQINTYF